MPRHVSALARAGCWTKPECNFSSKTHRAKRANRDSAKIGSSCRIGPESVFFLREAEFQRPIPKDGFIFFKDFSCFIFRCHSKSDRLLENHSTIPMLDFFSPFHDRPAMETLLEDRFDGPTSAIAKKRDLWSEGTLGSRSEWISRTRPVVAPRVS